MDKKTIAEMADDVKYQQGWHDALEAWKDMRLEVYAQASGNKHEPNDSDDATKMFSLNDIDEIFEKIAETCEEKPLLKVEPKFHEGEWIVNRNGGLWKIKKIFKNTYDIESLYGESLQPIKTVDMDCHLWTIKDVKPDDVIAWLEKQGGQKIDIPKWKYKKDNTPLLRDSIILNKYGCVAKSPSGAIISDAWVLDYDELAKLPKEEVEKQDEKPQVEAKDYSSIDPFFFKTTDVEKETDFKLELDFDFSVGQWIVACGKKVFRITKIDGFNVTLVDTNGDEYVFDVSSLKDARLWTIENAEDGDVLSNGKMIVIFKHFEEPSYKHIVAYIGLDEIGAIQVTDDTWNFGNYKTTPATKEQRDLLFQKMKKKGYTFDFEKRELKKIEKPTAWSQEDDYNLQCMIAKVTSDIQKGNIGRNQELMDWLKSLKQKIGG